LVNGLVISGRASPWWRLADALWLSSAFARVVYGETVPGLHLGAGIVLLGVLGWLTAGLGMCWWRYERMDVMS
jgi:hypothetical protein